MSESSSEDENTDRLNEAVWSFGSRDVKINGNGGASCSYYEDKNIRRPSLRTDVSKHEHDGNELGTTPEFQSHVAKKLGALLDGRISVFSGTVDSKHGQSKNKDEEDKESFRLFSTSAPGNWMEEPLPAPPKKRPIPSSSDSDSEMEMRFKEAAVSSSDILASAEQFLREKTEETSATKAEVIVIKKKKKKKRKKASTERSDESNTQGPEKERKSKPGEGTEEQTPVVESFTKKKKKKKRKLDEGKIDCDE